MFSNYPFTVKDRLFRYVQIDTQSDPHSTTCPSTEKQKELGQLLVNELKQLGIADAALDEYGYVYATVESTVEHPVPVICFCAHLDTAPDCSGSQVVPLLHPNYTGSPIVLPDDPDQVISTEQHPYLLQRIGDDIITASGKTLLGADDKAGVAIIMDTVQFLQSNPQIRHGRIRILFTPDEEIGRGVDKVNLERLGASAAYTLDGGERGSLEIENFSADAVEVVFEGVSAHPGAASGKMVSALKMAAAFISSLPREELSPETTADRYGFVHPVQLQGTVEQASVQLIIRDFITAKLEAYENFLRDKLADVLESFPGGKARFTVSAQYRNMKEILDQHPQVAELAAAAISAAGCSVKTEGIRGGTDGARLSFMGIPCPNIFTGEMALHGKHEYVSVQDMQKSVETLVYLAMGWEKQSRAAPSPAE